MSDGRREEISISAEGSSSKGKASGTLGYVKGLFVVSFETVRLRTYDAPSDNLIGTTGVAPCAFDRKRIGGAKSRR